MGAREKQQKPPRRSPAARRRRLASCSSSAERGKASVYHGRPGWSIVTVMAGDLDEQIYKLLRQHGPSEVLWAVCQAVEEQVRSCAPDGGRAEDVRELGAWMAVLGEMEETAASCSSLENEAGYPPADQRMRRDASGRGFDMGALFPWLRR